MKSEKEVLELVKSIPEALNTLKDWKERVTMRLRSGESYTATVAAVGHHTVLLREPAGRDFFDVLVSIDEIAAIEVQVRDR